MTDDLRAAAERALDMARQHQGRADDCGALARLVIVALAAEQPSDDAAAARVVRASVSVPAGFAGTMLVAPAAQPQPDYPCRSDGRCQYAIDSGAEGMGHCPRGKCVMPAERPQPDAMERDAVDALVEDGWTWDGDQWQRPAPAEQPQPVACVSIDTLSRMFEPLDGIDSNAWGYHWRKGWNDALRRAMDYASAAPPPPAAAPTDAQDAARYRWLREHAKEEPVRPETLDSEFPDMRTQWVLPALIAYGPVGGPTRTLDEAIDAALAAREGR